MPEEIKIISSEESVVVKADCTDEPDSALKSTAEADSVEAVDTPDTAPQTRLSDDGNQITLAIPSEETDSKAEEAVIDEQKIDNENFPALLLKEAPPYDEKRPRRIDGRFDFIELLIFTRAAVFELTSFVYRHSIVDGGSMKNTLQDKEILIISGLFYTPERYDIVVLEDHSTTLRHPIVKRVIALGGDEVRITNDKIYVNGEPVRDDFVLIDNCNGIFEGYTSESFTVPEGQIYVLGDHRDNSTDSRIFGSVPADAVLGKVLFRLYPFDRFGSVYADAEE